jgi:hypothetical protein
MLLGEVLVTSSAYVVKIFCGSSLGHRHSILDGSLVVPHLSCDTYSSHPDHGRI